MKSIDLHLRQINDPGVTPERAGILGANIWRIGLLMVAHRERICREEAELKQRQKEFMVKARKRKDTTKSKVQKIKHQLRKRLEAEGIAE